MIVIPNINDHLPLDKAELIAFFLETLLYGTLRYTPNPAFPFFLIENRFQAFPSYFSLLPSGFSFTTAEPKGSTKALLSLLVL